MFFKTSDENKGSEPEGVICSSASTEIVFLYSRIPNWLSGLEFHTGICILNELNIIHLNPISIPLPVALTWSNKFE